MSSGKVVGLFTADQQGEPMTAHALVEMVAGVGIAGDRYATGRGYWSDPRWPDQELTLIAAEVADELGLDAVQLRRNIVTRGVDLDALIGVTFQLGEAVIEGVRPCDPCRYLEGLTRPGVARALARRGGLRARVLVGGTIKLGDHPRVLPSVQPPSVVASTGRGPDEHGSA